ncbi:hypothetical protein [Pandoraea apista]|uniref:Lipoprotein n=1 Tax=Pandoraea apista TaxID=93218 RepID=A0A0G4JIK8_9BURK|nr:hypothetical protein [Pandoraea apista]ALS63761.1 hypothetical protein AT395_00940 [Pandoraea apista]OXS89838.1 hypothetical protein B7H01_21495 [Pandoraea apista]RRW98479.1 hypothetical protein EGJ54_03245 [Pandoraea apista]RRX05106.1 hypothetical protein EGJ56_06660 [Pandoraea apista]CFB63305.1 hypothetical protein LMG16407_03382 [Pandoraea apista]
MTRKFPNLVRACLVAPALFCVATALLVTGCATPSKPNTGPAATRPAAPDAATLRERHLAAADAAADQYRTCLYGHVARYINLVPDPGRLADEAAAECAPITERFYRERQAAILTYTSATDAAQQADAATLSLKADGLRVARARATELRAIR